MTAHHSDFLTGGSTFCSGKWQVLPTGLAFAFERVLNASQTRLKRFWARFESVSVDT
jgi:hypothetical protein